MVNETNKELMEMSWDGRSYYSLNTWLKQQFGTKVYKLSLNAGMNCPNRDGKAGRGGCIFCSEGGSGEFAAGSQTQIMQQIIKQIMAQMPEQIEEPIKQHIKQCIIQQTEQQIEAAKLLVSKKIPASGPYIAYFQSYTNTYAPVFILRELFTAAIEQPEITAISIATRPDCLEPEKIRLLGELNARKPVWVELGLQTIHPKTAAFIRRGYPLSCFEETVRQLKEAGLSVIVHLILGLPTESREQMLQSVDYLAHFSPAIDGVKLQLLHVLEGTDLAALYEAHPFPLFSMDEYIDFVITCLEHLPPSMVIHRITGDGPKNLLIAPTWSADKKRVLNTFTCRFKERNTWQGKYFSALK